MGKNEVRISKDFEFREKQQDETNSLILEGYITNFNEVTELWTGYYEKIDPGAFNETLQDGHNIVLLYHHDIKKPLASTRNLTLELTVDSIGLRFKATLNNNVSYAKDVYELIRSGEIRGCSFGFNCIEDSVTYNSENDSLTRTLLKLDLGEVSVLINPQYEDTSVMTRAQEIKAEEREKLKTEKELLELKTDLELIQIQNELI